jgi:hypothetical protein
VLTKDLLEEMVVDQHKLLVVEEVVQVKLDLLVQVMVVLILVEQKHEEVLV